jgi:hypothetical protein
MVSTATAQPAEEAHHAARAGDNRHRSEGDEERAEHNDGHREENVARHLSSFRKPGSTALAPHVMGRPPTDANASAQRIAPTRLPLRLGWDFRREMQNGKADGGRAQRRHEHQNQVA